MRKFSTSLEEFIRKSNLTQSKIAEMLDISEAWLIDLKKGRRKPPSPAKTKLYQKLDKLFHQPTDTFAKIAMQELYGTLNLYTFAQHIVERDSKKTVMVPVLGFTEGTHPDLCSFDANNPPDVEEYVDAPPGGDGKQLYALRVKGSSMSPRYNEGDTVYLSPAVEVSSGEEAIVVLEDGQCMLKKVKITGDSIMLISVQEDPVVIPRSKVRCMHRLMWVKR